MFACERESEMTTTTTTPVREKWGVYFSPVGGARFTLQAEAESENAAWRVMMDLACEFEYARGDWSVQKLPPAHTDATNATGDASTGTQTA
jgi:hypothetical protein